MDLELEEDLGICFDCAKQDDCPNRPIYEHYEECPDFEEKIALLEQIFKRQ